MTDRPHPRRADQIRKQSANAASKVILAALRPLIALAFVQWCASVPAQSYPAKPLHIIANTPPGGPVDLVARLTAQKLAEIFGRPVVVENRPGAGGTIGADYVAKSQPDGYTLLLASPASLCIAPALYPKLPYDPLKDFAPISIAAIASFMLVVHPSLPVNSVRNLVALARAKPGQLNYASAGNGTFTHLAMDLFKSMAKIEVVHVPYKGAAPAIIDLMTGQVQMMVNSAATAQPHLKSGKLRGLAVTGARRSAFMPELPTMSEAGVAGYDANNWYGVVARAGTPREIVASLNAAIGKSLNTAEMKQKLLAQGLEPMVTTPDNFAQIIRDEVPKWAKVVKDSGATLD